MQRVRGRALYWIFSPSLLVCPSLTFCLSLSPLSNDRRRCERRLIGKWKVNAPPHSSKIFCLEHIAVQGRGISTQVELHVIRLKGCPREAPRYIRTAVPRCVVHWVFNGAGCVWRKWSCGDDGGDSEAPWDAAETSLHIMESEREEEMSRGKCVQSARLISSIFFAECLFLSIFLPVLPLFLTLLMTSLLSFFSCAAWLLRLVDPPLWSKLKYLNNY